MCSVPIPGPLSPDRPKSWHVDVFELILFNIKRARGHAHGENGSKFSVSLMALPLITFREHDRDNLVYGCRS